MTMFSAMVALWPNHRMRFAMLDIDVIDVMSDRMVRPQAASTAAARTSLLPPRLVNTWRRRVRPQARRTNRLRGPAIGLLRKGRWAGGRGQVAATHDMVDAALVAAADGIDTTSRSGATLAPRGG